MRGSLHNIDLSSPTTEQAPGNFGSEEEKSPVGEEKPFVAANPNNPNDFKKNPFTLVKKKNLKQVRPKSFLKEDPPEPPPQPKGIKNIKYKSMLLVKEHP